MSEEEYTHLNETPTKKLVEEWVSEIREIEEKAD